MNRCLTKKSVVVVGIYCFIVVAVGGQAEFTVESEIERAAMVREASTYLFLRKP